MCEFYFRISSNYITIDHVSKDFLPYANCQMSQIPGARLFIASPNVDFVTVSNQFVFVANQPAFYFTQRIFPSYLRIWQCHKLLLYYMH